jgi:hypothetical protein
MNIPSNRLWSLAVIAIALNVNGRRRYISEYDDREPGVPEKR